MCPSVLPSCKQRKLCPSLAVGIGIAAGDLDTFMGIVLCENFCYVHQDGLALLVALPCRFWDLQVKGLDTWTSECSTSVAAVAAAISRAASNS